MERFLVGALCCAFSSAVWTATPAAAPANPISTPTADVSVQRLLDTRIAANPGTGIIVGVIDGNKASVYMAGTSGTQRPLDARTLFEVGSVTKTFTATVLMSMVGAGLVSLGDPVAKYLPDSVRVPQRDGLQITLQNLATQHSGLPRLPTNFHPKDGDNPYADYSVSDLYAFLNGYVLTRDPGASFEYSNVGIGLLGQALSNRAGIDYATLVRKRVLAPLGMNETTIALSAADRAELAIGHDADGDAVPPWEFKALVGAGGIRSSMDDMLKYLRCNLGQGPLAALCLTTQKPRATFPGHKIGLVWWIDDDTGVVEHAGDTAGFHAMIAMTKDRKKGVVVLANGGQPVENIAYAVLGYPQTTVPYERVALDEHTIAGYLGTYVTKAGNLIVGRKGTALTAKLADQQALRIYPQGYDHFAFHAVDATMRFLRDSRGKVVALALFQGGQVLQGSRLDRDGKSLPEPSSAPYPPVRTLSREAQKGYVGIYDRGGIGGTFAVSIREKYLSVRISGQPAYEMFYYAKDRFFLKVVDADIQFVRGANGLVIGLILHQDGSIWPIALRVRGAAAAALSSASVATAPSSPYEIYFAALKAMDAVVPARFIRYTDTEVITHAPKIRRIVSVVTERTFDHMTRVVGTNPDGSLTSDVYFGKSFLPADSFLRRGAIVQSDPSGSSFDVGTEPLPTIAEVHSTNYTIAFVGDETTNGCVGARHIELTPNSSPIKFNLRELWIDASTHRICQADVERTISVGSRVNAIMRITLWPDGYVSSASTVATGKMLGFPYSITYTDTMTDPVSVSPVPTGFR